MLKMARLTAKTDYSVIMLTLPLAVGNMSIAYKITIYIYIYIYIIFTQATISSKSKERLLYLPNKIRQSNIFYNFCLHLFFLMFRIISTLQIIFFPFKLHIICKIALIIIIVIQLLNHYPYD
jgi:hypothetical protein